MIQGNQTPGPWEVVDGDRPGIDGDDGNRSIVIFGDQTDDPEIGIQGRSEEERQANARLIAAAPDLVDALRELHDFAERSLSTRYAGRSVMAFKRAAELLAKLEN